MDLFGNLPVPISTLANATPINDGTKLVAYTNEPKLNIQLFEGDWNIELAKVSSEDPAGNAIYWKVVPLTFEDYLIVQIGDSYSSGEGMPEQVGAPYGVWGDDGTVQNFPISDPNYFDCLTADDINECLQLKAFGTGINFEHEIAHRSSYTWGSLAAQEIEMFSPQTSVTYINLAASGARIGHQQGKGGARVLCRCGVPY